MKHLKTIFVIGAVAGLLAACATPELPTAGKTTPWDGQWAGSLPSKGGAACEGLTTQIEVRYGHLLGSVSKKGTKKGDLWGEIQPDGSLKGHIGRSGISGGYADLKFNGNSLTGTWVASDCSGTVNISKKG